MHLDHGRCIHARFCVTGEPEVFKANTPGDWIFPDAATPERIAGQDIGLRATLCRCGMSKRKPFCDFSHEAAGFEAPGA